MNSYIWTAEWRNKCKEDPRSYFPQFKYMNFIYHNFIFIFPGYITNQFNDQLPVGLLAQLVRALHRYRRGQGSNPGKPNFSGFLLATA